MAKKTSSDSKHASRDVENAISLFFAVRGLMRAKFAQGKKLNPYAWLHVETMIFIREQEGPSMRVIAGHLAITAPSATSLLSALVKGGLVRRARDARDARASRLYLTKKGAMFLATTQVHGRKVFAELFSVLSPRELAMLSTLLKRVLSHKER